MTTWNGEPERPARVPVLHLVSAVIVQDSAADAPATDPAVAAAIASALMGRAVVPEPDGAGAWLVAFTDAELAELRSEGLFQRADESRYLLAELP